VIGRAAKALLFTILLAVAVAGGGYYRLVHWAHAPHVVDHEIIFDFKQGTTLTTLSQELARAGVVSSASLFHSWVRLVEGDYQRFQAGHYRFDGAITPQQVEEMMLKGDIYAPIVAQITIPEGFTMRQTLERLAANGIGTLGDLRALARNKAFLAELRIPSTTLEGYIYPATYIFHSLPTPHQALSEMVKSFWQHLPRNYETQVHAMGLSLSDAVTFASLIELETRHDDEKPLISEVIWRRLKDRTPLAIDAAVIYGVADYKGNLTWANLADTKNPYNTRVHIGLPPTPIGSPDLKALEAVLTPSNFGYYYYVLIPGEGRHHFSRTLQEHNEHVKKLVESTKREKGNKDKHH